MSNEVNFSVSLSVPRFSVSFFRCCELSRQRGTRNVIIISSLLAQMALGVGDQFCLRWNNYHCNMTSVINQLLAEEAFVDVTLACDGARIKAHRVIDRLLFTYSNFSFIRVRSGRSLGLLALLPTSAARQSVQASRFDPPRRGGSRGPSRHRRVHLQGRNLRNQGPIVIDCQSCRTPQNQR